MYLCLIKHQRSYILCCGVTTLFVKKQLALFALACVRRTKQSRHVEQDKDNDVNYSNFDHFLSLNIFKQNVLEHCDNDHYEKQWYDYHMIIIIFSGIIHVGTTSAGVSRASISTC